MPNQPRPIVPTTAVGGKSGIASPGGWRDVWLFLYYYISEPNYYDSVLNHYPKGVAGKITGVKGKEDRGRSMYFTYLLVRVV